ncbi:MAG TPA: TlpA disulfide reductase family protein, partial [Alphaproteobacteria bacterium]|nr:TlpA disulfide reductase family protein [Alphaproteobacteria bacterium]
MSQKKMREKKIGLAVLAVLVLGVVLFGLVRGMKAPQPVFDSSVQAPAVVAGSADLVAATAPDVPDEGREGESTPPEESESDTDSGRSDGGDSPPGGNSVSPQESRSPGPPLRESSAISEGGAASLPGPASSPNLGKAEPETVVLLDADRLTPADVQAFGALFKVFKAYEPPEMLPSGLGISTTDGRSLAFADFRGGWLVVNFWASWCPPCVEELPAFDRLARKLSGSRVQMVAVSLDSKLDAKVIAAFVREKGLGNVALYFDSTGGLQKTLAM